MKIGESCVCWAVGPALQSNSSNCLVLILHRQLGNYDSVNQAFQEVNYAIIDSIEFSLDPGTGKLKIYKNHKLCLLNFHIVDVEGPILIGLGTMLKLDMIQIHPQIHISSIDINAIRPSLARQGEKDAEIDDISNSNDSDSVSE